MRNHLAALLILGSLNCWALPVHYDLRDTEVLPPVRMQSSCAGTWGAATVDLMAINIKLKDGLDVNLSEQHIAACNTAGHKCHGGGMPHLEMMVSPGAVLEKDFPSVGHDVACPANLPVFRKAQGMSAVPTAPWRSIPHLDAIKKSIVEHGPVLTAVQVTSKMSKYKQGVFQQCDGTGSVNHLMILVGWDDRGGYWIARNTWGEKWGEEGYIRLSYGCNGIGTMAQFLIY